MQCALLFTIFTACIFINACINEQQLSYGRYYMNGKNLYERTCQNCHNVDGKGLGMLIPPLTDSVFLKQNKNRLACMIKYGLNEKVIIHNKTYKEKMLPNDQLSDIDIAQLVVYITNSFGNNQGFYDVSEAHDDLMKCGDYSPLSK
jgi:cytochrome c